MNKKLARLLLIVTIISGYFFLDKDVFALSWSYPLYNTLQRENYKTFGQYINSEFYKNKDNLFPAKYYGYHAGTDFEISPQELDKKIPVFAIYSGTITFIGNVQGYGGLILEELDNKNLTALYGHLNIKNTELKVGDKVKTGKQISYLGKAFSDETGGERKHLHFAIYKGDGQYFKGYEENKNDLNQKWIDPVEFLKSKKAIDPKENAKSTPSKENNLILFIKNIIDGLLGSIIH